MMAEMPGAISKRCKSIYIWVRSAELLTALIDSGVKISRENPPVTSSRSELLLFYFVGRWWLGEITVPLLHLFPQSI